MSKEYTYEEAIALFHQNAVNGMEKACTLLEADTKLLTHVQTGTLRRSWTHSVESSKNEIVGKVGTNVEYAPYENWYHPNLSEAVAKDQNQIVEIIASEIQKV